MAKSCVKSSHSNSLMLPKRMNSLQGMYCCRFCHIGAGANVKPVQFHQLAKAQVLMGAFCKLCELNLLMGQVRAKDQKLCLGSGGDVGR